MEAGGSRVGRGEEDGGEEVGGEGGGGDSSCVKLKSMRARAVFCISNEKATLKKCSLLR